TPSKSSSRTTAAPPASSTRLLITSAYVVPSSSPNPGYGRTTSRLALIVFVGSGRKSARIGVRAPNCGEVASTLTTYTDAPGCIDAAGSGSDVGSIASENRDDIAALSAKPSSVSTYIRYVSTISALVGNADRSSVPSLLRCRSFGNGSA